MHCRDLKLEFAFCLQSQLARPGDPLGSRGNRHLTKESKDGWGMLAGSGSLGSGLLSGPPLGVSQPPFGDGRGESWLFLSCLSCFSCFRECLGRQGGVAVEQATIGTTLARDLRCRASKGCAYSDHFLALRASPQDNSSRQLALAAKRSSEFHRRGAHVLLLYGHDSVLMHSAFV